MALRTRDFFPFVHLSRNAGFFFFTGGGFAQKGPFPVVSLPRVNASKYEVFFERGRIPPPFFPFQLVFLYPLPLRGFGRAGTTFFCALLKRSFSKQPLSWRVVVSRDDQRVPSQPDSWYYPPRLPGAAWHETLIRNGPFGRVTSVLFASSSFSSLRPASSEAVVIGFLFQCFAPVLCRCGRIPLSRC